MDSRHVGWTVAVLLVPSFTAGVSAAAKPSTAIEDAAIDVPDTHRQTGQNNSTGLSEPDLMMVIDNRAVADGDTITADGNPTLTVRTNGSAPIDLLVVRVNGDSRRIYTPNNTAVNETATLDVNADGHALEVLIQSNGRTTAHRAMIVEDSIAPVIVFSSPLRAGNTSIYDYPGNNYATDRSQIQLDGALHDYPDVKQVTIELRYHGQGVDAPWGFRKRIVTDDPSTSISRSLRLEPFDKQVGAGQNNPKITALGSRGHRRHYNVNLYVEDKDPPLIEVPDQRLMNIRPAVRLTIRVASQVDIRSVGVRRGLTDGSGLNYGIQPKSVGAHPIGHTFTKTIPLAGDSRNITITADGGIENVTRREIEVDRTRLTRPAIEVRPDTLRVSNNHVYVEGRVYDGRATSVYAETVDSTGNAIDLAQIYGGGVISAVTFNETLQLDSYPTCVRIRTADSTGREHIESVQVVQPNAAADPETASTTNPDSTVRTNTSLSGVPSEPSSQGLLGTLVEAVRNLVSATVTGESLEV